MTKIGLGLPGISVEDVRLTAEAACGYDFDSFSVYGDLGDLPPYAVLHASADTLRHGNLSHIGPLGVPVALQHPEVTAMHAIALEQQLPAKTSVGLVRGAFLKAIGRQGASLEEMQVAIEHIRSRMSEYGYEVPIYMGAFGPRMFKLAGELSLHGVKLGGSTNVAMARSARRELNSPSTEVILGAVSVIDSDRKAARELARKEVAKYLAVVGPVDHTLSGDDLESLVRFSERFSQGDSAAPDVISDSLLDKFSMAGTPEDALARLEIMDGYVDRFEFGTPHGLGGYRPSSIRYIAEAILKQR